MVAATIKAAHSSFTKGQVSAAQAKRRAAAEGAAAFDALCASRPLKPPPLPYQPPRARTAGELALAEDIRRGVVSGLAFRIEEIEAGE